ncbi:MAG: glutamate formimidoyltransferase [Ignavibacteriaceae bacterium]|jgi:glutamate formiminotransferase/formiminotetrahydrofolate cyclodeaminase
MKVIECVPNFSEGKREDVFLAMKDSLNGIKNCKLLNLEPDEDYNRVVVTLAGDETGILDGMIAISKSAAANIDMTQHKGKHPRIGAIDVVPFIPIKNASMDDCIRISEAYAEYISESLNVPVYLYENSARNPERKNLSDIRKGEYEGLEAKLKDPKWQPDYGKSIFNPKTGAIITGARFFLVAYNVNLKTTDIKFAKEIAEILRESGSLKKDANGKIIIINGESIREPGRLKNVKGMGVSLEKYKITQVSMNLTNYNITPIHLAFEEVRKEAGRRGIEILGSEIVGLVPLEALIQAGLFYAAGKKLDEKSLVDLSIEKLGLSELNPFHKNEKIIDYMI